MKSPSSKYLTGFIFRFILGTLFVLCMISTARVLLTNRSINKATVLLNAGDSIAAIKQLQNASLWHLSYPSQARRIDHLMIHASLMQNDHTTAQKHSEMISNRKQHSLDDVSSLLEKALIYPDQLINVLVDNYAPPEWDISPEQFQQPFQNINTEPQSDNNNPPAKEITHRPNTPSMPDIQSSLPKANPASTAFDATEKREILPVTTEWGITIDPKTTVYSSKGKNLGHIPAGAILNIIRQKPTPKGDFIICLLVSKKNVRQIIIRRNDAIIYQGDINKTTKEQRRLAIQHAKLVGQMSVRETQLKKVAAVKNPYASQYKTALVAYKKMAVKNNSILKAYNDSSGPRRMELADKLRLIKHDSEEGKKEFAAIKKQYKEWKTQNPSTNIDFSNDSQIRGLKQKIKSIEDKLSGNS